MTGALLIGSLALVLSPLPVASAATAQVSVTDYAFTSSTVTVSQGGLVAWSFHSMHTTTSNQGFWDSGMRSSGAYTVRFSDAGTFGYHCTMHPFMTGRVRVPLRASGSAAHGWRITWSARTSTPANRRFDVQLRKPGTTAWSSYRAGTGARTAAFDPARPGRYAFRARTHNGARGASGWSPTLVLKIS